MAARMIDSNNVSDTDYSDLSSIPMTTIISDYVTSTDFVNSSIQGKNPFPLGNYTLRWSPPPLGWAGIMVIPFYVLIFVLAVLGNTLVILTLVHNKRMRTVTNVFLINLSVSDLLLAVLCMPFTIAPILLKNFIFGQTMCFLIRYMQGVSVGTSCFTLVAISLERYFAICRPLHSRKWQTLSHSYKAIIVCWVIAFVVMIPIPIFTVYRPLPYGNFRCAEMWHDLNWEKAYATFLVLVLLVNPVLIMSVAYGLIVMTLWTGMKRDTQSEQEALNGTLTGSRREETTTFIKDDDCPCSPTEGCINGKTVAPMKNVDSFRSTKSKLRYDLQRGMRQSNSEKSRAAKRRVIKMLFAVVYEFFLCWTPLYVVQTWIIFDYKTATTKLSSEALLFINLIAYISSCCNPITYCFMNRNFRQGFLSVFRCLRSKKWRRGKSDISYSGNYPSISRTAVSTIPNYDKIHDSRSSEKPDSDD